MVLLILDNAVVTKGVLDFTRFRVGVLVATATFDLVDKSLWLIDFFG